MPQTNVKKYSKFMSLVLRHNPQAAGISLDAHGWAEIDALVRGMNENGFAVTSEGIQFVVKNNDKKRFNISQDGTKIRAAQGHSVAVDVELKESEPPEFLYHGTQKTNEKSILSNGINSGRRLHVHLSEDLKTARIVGSRRGKDFVIFEILAKKMFCSGHKFFLSENNVWLADFVPPEYIKYICEMHE